MEQYRVVTKNSPCGVLWTGTLSECLYHIGHCLHSHNTWKTVTASQSVMAGYSIIKA